MTIEAMKAVQMVYANTTKHDWPDDIWDAICQAVEAEKHEVSQEPMALQMDVIVVNLVREGINKHRARELAEHFIKHTHPPTQEFVCSTGLCHYAAQRQWVELTDEDRQAAFESLPDMLEGFLKKWGWLHFSKALEDKLKEKNGY